MVVYKNQGHIIKYGQNDYYHDGEYTKCFNREYGIELGKTHQALDYKIIKVFENYIYLVNSDCDTAIVVDYDNQDTTFKFKIDTIADFKFQSKIHPFILSEFGVYNVFYPKPIVSWHDETNSSDISSGVIFDSNSAIQRFVKKTIGLENSLNEKINEVDGIIDFIPEYFMGLYYRHTSIPNSEKRLTVLTVV